MKTLIKRAFVFTHIYFPAAGQAAVTGTGVHPSSTWLLPSFFVAHTVQQYPTARVFFIARFANLRALSHFPQALSDSSVKFGFCLNGDRYPWHWYSGTTSTCWWVCVYTHGVVDVKFVTAAYSVNGYFPGVRSNHQITLSIEMEARARVQTYLSKADACQNEGSPSPRDGCYDRGAHHFFPEVPRF